MKRWQYLLGVLSEECNEVGQRANKASRFGLFEIQDGQTMNNEERIVQEFADLLGVYEMLELPWPSREMIDAKKSRVEKYMAISAERGLVNNKSKRPKK
jgi:hypothetical protein